MFVWQGQGGIYFKAAAAAAKSIQSCPTLCDPIDGSPYFALLLRHTLSESITQWFMNFVVFPLWLLGT